VRYVVHAHAHADQINGGEVFQNDRALIVANDRAFEPIFGELLPTAVPDSVLDRDMKITLGEADVLLHRVSSSHSNSMTMVLYPKYEALQCSDVCRNMTLPYNDFLDFYYFDWIKALDWVATHDVDIIDVGHYELSTRKERATLRVYLTDLNRKILDMVRQGQSWDQLYRSTQSTDEVKS